MSDIIEGEVLESKIIVDNDDFSEKLAGLKDIGIDPNTVKMQSFDNDGMSKLYSDPNYLKMVMNKYTNVKTNKGPVYTQKSLEKRTQERRIKNKRAAKARRK